MKTPMVIKNSYSFEKGRWVLHLMMMSILLFCGENIFASKDVNSSCKEAVVDNKKIEIFKYTKTPEVLDTRDSAANKVETYNMTPGRRISDDFMHIRGFKTASNLMHNKEVSIHGFWKDYEFRVVEKGYSFDIQFFKDSKLEYKSNAVLPARLGVLPNFLEKIEILEDGYIVALTKDILTPDIFIWKPKKRKIFKGFEYELVYNSSHASHKVDIVAIGKNKFIEVGFGRYIYLIDALRSEVEREIKFHTGGEIGAILLEPNKLFSWDGKGKILIWNPHTLEIDHIVNKAQKYKKNPNNEKLGHKSAVLGALKIDSQYVLTWSEDHTLGVVDSNSGKFVRHLGEFFNSDPLIGHTTEVQGAVSLGNNKVLSWSKHAQVFLWDTESGKLLHRLDRGDLEFYPSNIVKAIQLDNMDIVVKTEHSTYLRWKAEEISLMDVDSEK